MRQLTKEELNSITGGEPITLALVFTYVVIAVVTVIIWKIFQSKRGKFAMPGGWLFEWEK